MPEEKMDLENDKLQLVADMISSHWHKMIDTTIEKLPGLTQEELFSILSLSLINEVTNLLDSKGITELNAISNDDRRLTITLTTLESPNHETH